MYVVAIDGIREKTERKVVADYVRSQTPDLTYSDDELDDYLISIAPDATSAGMAFQRILSKDKTVLQPFVEALINVIMANGSADEKERIFLAKVLDLLEVGAIISVISFHSLEDRVVKQFFKYHSTRCHCDKTQMICTCPPPKLELINKKPIVASDKELGENPPSRSAKLRVAKRI